MRGLVLEAFAGPGGWSEGLRILDVQNPAVGFEWDRDACRTATAAGHARVRADVAQVPLGDLAFFVWLLIMSPPCQAWSRAGKRGGIKDQPAVFAHAQRVIAAGEWIPYQDQTWHDDRSPLVLEVLRWILATRPVNIALEQVPDVLPFWQMVAHWLGQLGYSAWCGHLSSERYGVAQTRQRAVLIASSERKVGPPQATHTAYRSSLPEGGRWQGTEGDLLGDGLLPWVSMADALGWGFEVQPSPTVSSGGTSTGGAEVFANFEVRRRLAAEVRMRSNYGTGGDPADRGERAATEPAATVTGKAGRNLWVMGDVRSAHGTVRIEDEPAATITAAMDNGNSRWVYVNGSQANAARRPVGDPAPTVHFAERMNDVRWVEERPATTVQGDPRLAEPGHRDRDGGERQFSGQSVRVSVEEAAILQSFPPGYPWQGTKSKQHEQVGNAVPPLLAAHVLAAVLGLQVPERLEAAA